VIRECITVVVVVIIIIITTTTTTECNLLLLSSLSLSENVRLSPSSPMTGVLSPGSSTLEALVVTSHSGPSPLFTVADTGQ
jgi:hypothetical protein